jgi:hypothetical protein
MVALLALLTFGGEPADGATLAQRCASNKTKETCRKAACKLRCHATAAQRGTATDPFCLARCEGVFNSRFSRIESRGGCATLNDRAAIEAKVDAFVDDVSVELTGSPTGSLLTTTAARRCGASKVRATGRKDCAKLRCHARAKLRGTSVDPFCLQRAEAAFTRAFNLAESRGGCATTNDRAAIEAKVDAFVEDVAIELPSTVGSTTTTNPATTTTVVSTTSTLITLPTLPSTTTFTLPMITTTTLFGVTTTTVPTCAPIVTGQPISNTYQLLGIAGPRICHTNSSANKFGPCSSDLDCGGTLSGCTQTPWVSADGITLPFPVGINTTFTVSSAGSFPACNHVACVNCGNPSAVCPGVDNGCNGNGSCLGGGTPGSTGRTCCDQPNFTAPSFLIAALGACSRIDQKACGLGEVNTSNPQTGDNEVIKEGDTSDPGPDCIYDAGDPTQPCNTGAGGAGADTKGKIVRTIGDGSADPAGIHFRFVTPMLSTTWAADGQGCPTNATFDAGETLLTQLVLQAEPSSAGASARYVDMDADSCSFAGSGFSGPGPVDASAAATPQPYNGSSGPTNVAVGFALSGSFPLFDIGFVAVIPNGAATVQTSQSCSCTPVTGCPE